MIGDRVKCQKCNGVGAPWNNSASVPCDLCGGTGIVVKLIAREEEIAALVDSLDAALRDPVNPTRRDVRDFEALRVDLQQVAA
jgi:hypothetical protein